MGLLALGVLLWTVAHLFKRLAPEARAKLGGVGRGIVTLAIAGSVGLMILGYQSAETQYFWGPNTGTVILNSILTFLALYLFVASVTKSGITGKIRHVQLTAVKSWALGHLLVNGDSAAFVLFGGLLAWAVISVILINKQDGKPAFSADSSSVKELLTAGIAVAVYGVVIYLHGMAGYPVYG